MKSVSLEFAESLRMLGHEIVEHRAQVACVFVQDRFLLDGYGFPDLIACDLERAIEPPVSDVFPQVV